MMKKISTISLALLMIFSLSNAYSNANNLQESFTVTVDQNDNGSVTVSPALPADGKVAAGTTIRVTATPAAGYLLDASYFSRRNPNARFASRTESSLSTLELTVNGDITVGATFIPASKLAGVNVTYDVVYAQPGVKKLKYDVYSPVGAKKLPIIVIIHGGGWSSNTEEVMRGLSRDLVAGGKYVVCNIDYRWINTGDGDAVPNTMADLIGDVFGAIAHIQEHAAEYGGDPNKIAVTGDSAGGHLSASAANMCALIGDGGFGKTPGVYEFMPSYLPKGKTAAKVNKSITKAIKAAAPSYGVFDRNMLGRFVEGIDDPKGIAALCPIDNIPNVKDRAVPQYLLRGTNDNLINHESVQAYADALKAAGQRVEYVQVEGIGHAFLDWKTDARTQNTYNEVGHKYALDMKRFFDTVFYPGK
ncbi:MAG: alpha/beta fold hydrolase [Bacteroidales bacterium]|jgi:acetyl esterase